MGKKEQAPALAIFVQGSLWVWSATSRGRPPDGGLALAVFHMVPRVPAAPNLFVHPPADLRKVLLPPSSRPARLLRLTVFCPASSGDGSSIVGRGRRRPPRATCLLVYRLLVYPFWFAPFSVYVALTYIPGGGLLTGFAMRSDPNVVFG